MQVAERRAVSPIIATLLLIAIAVAAGIIVYVFTSSITGNLTQSGGQQVADQVSMDAYSFGTLTNPIMVLRNVGSSSVTITSVYFDGNLCQASGVTCTAAPGYTVGGAGQCTAGPVCTTGQYVSTLLTVTSQTSGTSHLIRIVTSDGGTFTFSVIAGRSG
jgi:archaeal type IV pilus assembly protein PilA